MTPESDKPRILHVITGLATGGAEMMLLKLLSATRDKYGEAVISLKDEGTIGPRIKDLGVPVWGLGLHTVAPNPLFLFRLRHLVRQFWPDLIQGWMYHGNSAANLTAALYSHRVPILWNIQQSLYDISKERWLTAAVIRLGIRQSRKATAIIYNSRTSAGQHEAFGYSGAKSLVIPTGYDCSLFHPDHQARLNVRRELGIANDEVLVGLVARYHPMKDHAGFLKSAALVCRRYGSVKFVLVGKDLTERQPAIQKLISENQLKSEVLLLGERTDLPRLTPALDIACSASAWGEGFSNAVGEAMACGVPCVVTDVGDSAYAVGDTGLTVPPKSPEALAEAIARLIEAGPEARSNMGIAARERVLKEFSLAAVSSRYHDLYRNLLKKEIDPVNDSAENPGSNIHQATH